MGRAKDLWMAQQEEGYLEAKTAWIQEQLNDYDADESTAGWDELSDAYDELLPDREQYEDDWVVYGKSRIQVFDEIIESSREILGVSLSHSSSKNLRVMLHAHVVTAVESYLSSSFIENALSAELYMRRLVENDPEFAKRKFSIKEIFTKQENLKSDLSQYLKDLIFHDIAKVKPMYFSVFGIDFGDIAWLFNAVTLRHHCVHRAGYDKEGNEVCLTKESINQLIDQCERLIHIVESKLISMPDDGSIFWKTT